MANPHKGEVSFKSGDKEYTLSLTINAMCELDEALGIEDALNTLVARGKLSVRQSRTMFFVALKHHHEEIKDEQQAAALVTFGEMNRLLTLAIQRASGETETENPEPAGKTNGAAHPQQPDRSVTTGPAS
jgi:hypothetical protein